MRRIRLERGVLLKNKNSPITRLHSGECFSLFPHADLFFETFILMNDECVRDDSVIVDWAFAHSLSFRIEYVVALS